jgi:hypothetical protein
MKKKGTRKNRKNKRTTQRRKNRSYKRMKGGVIKFPWWITPLKTNLDVNATRVISESLPILGFSRPDVMPTGDKLLEFRDACVEFIDMMQNKEKFSTFYDSNINSINPMFELLMPVGFTRVARYDDNIIELFKQGTIPNTVEKIETTLTKYVGESKTSHVNPKKFNLLAFALFIMKIQKLNIFPFPLPPASQEIIDDINTRFEEILKYKWDDGLYNLTPLDSIQVLWERMYNSLFYENEIELLNDECKNYIIRLCGVVSNPSKSILLQALLYYEMLPTTADKFREIYDKYKAGTASAEEIRQLTIALILIVTKLQS